MLHWSVYVIRWEPQKLGVCAVAVVPLLGSGACLIPYKGAPPTVWVTMLHLIAVGPSYGTSVHPPENWAPCITSFKVTEGRLN